MLLTHVLVLQLLQQMFFFHIQFFVVVILRLLHQKLGHYKNSLCCIIAYISKLHFSRILSSFDFKDTFFLIPSLTCFLNLCMSVCLSACLFLCLDIFESLRLFKCVSLSRFALSLSLSIAVSGQFVLVH